MQYDKHIYRLLQEHLDKLPIGFPKTESGVEIKILQHLFNNFEAKVALCLSLGNASVLTIQRRLKRKFNDAIEPDELSTIQDRCIITCFFLFLFFQSKFYGFLLFFIVFLIF